MRRVPIRTGAAPSATLLWASVKAKMQNTRPAVMTVSTSSAIGTVPSEKKSLFNFPNAGGGFIWKRKGRRFFLTDEGVRDHAKSAAEDASARSAGATRDASGGLGRSNAAAEGNEVEASSCCGTDDLRGHVAPSLGNADAALREDGHGDGGVEVRPADAGCRRQSAHGVSVSWEDADALPVETLRDPPAVSDAPVA